MSITVLGIESSCDETAAAVYNTDSKLLSSRLFSQTEAHKCFGGVVPEIASRYQLEKINIVVDQALRDAQITLKNVDVIAVTNRPGLAGSLLVGVCFAKSLAYAAKTKIIGVNHLEGHAFSSFLEHQVPFAHICLTASGGHTSIYYISDFGNYTVLGQTLDDAAGEAFDKIAKMLNLPYPGGPIIEKLAREVSFQDFFHYPRLKNNTLNMSFSGLKTAVLYDLVKKGYYDLERKLFLEPDNIELKQRVASSLLVCVGDIFEQKLRRAIKAQPDVQAVTFVGGVACNKYLRQRLRAVAESNGKIFYAPSPIYCTDNAAMISFVGHYKAQQGKFDDLTLDI